MKTLAKLAVLWFVLLVGCSTPAANVGVPDRVPAQFLDVRSVALTAWSNELEAYRNFCAGTWIAQDVIVTANHCVDSTDTVMFAQPQQFPDLMTVHPTSAFDGTVIARSIEADVALVRANNYAPHEVASLGSVNRGDQISIMGSPRGRPFVYSVGYVMGFYRMDLLEGSLMAELLGISGRPIDMVVVEGYVFFGSSGGGAFNANGELIGVADLLFRDDRSAYFVPAGEIKRLADEAFVAL